MCDKEIYIASLEHFDVDNLPTRDDWLEYQAWLDSQEEHPNARWWATMKMYEQELPLLTDQRRTVERVKNDDGEWC